MVDFEAIYYLGMKIWCSRRETGHPEGHGDLLSAVFQASVGCSCYFIRLCGWCVLTFDWGQRMSCANAKYVTQFSSKGPQALTRATTRAVSTNAEYVAELPLSITC